VSEVAGKEIYQAYVGSSANPGMRDFAIAARIVEGKQVHSRVSFDVNPTSRQILENLAERGPLTALIRAGARIHQAGCNGCIGMGQAPASDSISLRTVPRNFPGRSGTPEDKVCLVSPETAAASALTGKITDPRTLEMTYSRFKEPKEVIINEKMLVAPSDGHEHVELRKGPNIKSLPPIDPLSHEIAGEVLIKVGDDISTDEIMPAGARILPYRSNIPEISKFVFEQVAETYYDRAMASREQGHLVVGGENYGQGSSREHAALAPRYLGLRAVIAKSFARIHWQNLINFGILPLTFVDNDDWDDIVEGDQLRVPNVRKAISSHNQVEVLNERTGETFMTEHTLSKRQVEMVLAGGLINLFRKQHSEKKK
jgi:aconitate hydratase